jgi:Flp pilus assembly protein TadD
LQKLGFSCDSASEYNLHLLNGIFHAQNNNFSQAFASFNQAANLRKEFSDPTIYKSLTKIAEYNRNPKTKDRTLLQEAL